MSSVTILSAPPPGPHLVRLGVTRGQAFVVLRAEITFFSRRSSSPNSDGSPNNVVRYALLLLTNGRLYIRSLDSNLQFKVNGAAVQESELRDEDILHAGDAEYRVCLQTTESPASPTPPRNFNG